MEENKKKTLFYRVVNSKTSVIVYILTLAIFYFGSIAGGLFIINNMMSGERVNGSRAFMKPTRRAMPIM